MRSFSFYWEMLTKLSNTQVSWSLLFLCVVIGVIAYFKLKEIDKLRKTIVCQIVSVDAKEYDSLFYFPICIPQISIFEGMTYTLDYPPEYFEPPKRVKAILNVIHKGEKCRITLNESKIDFDNHDLSIGSMMTANCRQKSSDSKDFKLIKMLACQLI